MTTNDSTPDLAWLDKAETAYAAEAAARSTQYAKWAADLARELNERLDDLGITPVTPAGVDGESLVPALLVPADPEGQFYGVHATFDEEEGIGLRVSDYRAEGGFEGLRHTPYKHFNSVRDVLDARRGGPAKEPAPRPQTSLDTEAIVEALDRLTAAVNNVAREARRP